MNHEKMVEARMTEEDLKKLAEERQNNWKVFIKKLEDNPTLNVTNEDLHKAIKFISEDMGGMIQMIQTLDHNAYILRRNFEQIINALQGTAPVSTVNKTKSGIILP